MQKSLLSVTSLFLLLFSATAFGQDASLTALINPVQKSCFGAAEDVRVTIKNAATSGSPLTSVPVQVVITGPVSQTLTATYTGSLGPNQTANLLMGQLNMSAPGTYQFAASTQLPGDIKASNDALALKMINVTAAASLPMPVVDFTGSNFEGLFPGWYEARGENFPSEVKDAYWRSTYKTSGTPTSQFTHFGTATAVIWLSKGRSASQGTLNQRDWIVSPAFMVPAGTHLRFKVAVTNGLGNTGTGVMGSDDVLKVMVSSDCATTFTSVLTLDKNSGLTNALQQFDVDLSAYSGQNVTVGLYATDNEVDDPEEFEFHLDDVALVSGVSGVLTGNTAASFTMYPNPAAEKVTIAFNEVKAEGLLELRTIHGKLVKTEAFALKSEIQFSTGDIVPGVYLLSVKSGTFSGSRKVLITR